MKSLWIFCIMGTQLAWADYNTIATKPVNLSELTAEAKRVVPDLEGMSQDGNTLTFRRLTGEFTEEEQAKLNERVEVHDADVAKKRKQQRENDLLTRQTVAREKLRGFGLTDEEIDLLF